MCLVAVRINYWQLRVLMPPLLFGNILGMVLNVCPLWRVMKMKSKACLGMHLGTLLATSGRDKSVCIWEVLPGNEFECVSVLQGHTQDVKMVQWHPLMHVLFSCSYDNTVKVWAEDGDSDDWHCVQTLGESNDGHSSTVWASIF
ncbi:hypothetical protein F0562_016054 [Nyssa sinensis]|uniref:Uncharacterized protein n=1 Tax=Nyssa sinensis TaxID=561372 RepID=A0A5J4ZIT3_9ASTE|nr:hypothetical protein F0562_016054 [Nyssa sinensis]